MGDDKQTELCTHCQREIPAANFIIHSLYCARNLKVCHKCKEPVPLADMKDHLANVFCKQCGERMQACDLAAHQREACSQTTVHCAYCTLSLARALMNDHEVYCGARTERCDECGELVMIKYRKLHEDSNHGFLKLDDEPGPQPSWSSSRQSSTTSQKTSAIQQPSIKKPTPSQSFPVQKPIPPQSFPVQKPIPPQSFPTQKLISPQSFPIQKSTAPLVSTAQPSIPSSVIRSPLAPQQPTAFQPFMEQNTSFLRQNQATSAAAANDHKSSLTNATSPSEESARFSDKYYDDLNKRQAEKLMEKLRKQNKNGSKKVSNNAQYGYSDPGPVDRMDIVKDDTNRLLNARPNINQQAGSATANDRNPPLTNATSPNEDLVRFRDKCDDLNTRQAKKLMEKFRKQNENGSKKVSNLYESSDPDPVGKMDIAKDDTNIQDSNKMLNIGSPGSKGAIKKYQAPQPPNPKRQKDSNKQKSIPNQPTEESDNYCVRNPPPFKHSRNVPMYSALLREQNQLQERQRQTEYNLAHGLPPVLNPLEKLDKLRKLDALQNMDFDENIKVKKDKHSKQRNIPNDSSSKEFNFTPMSEDELLKRLQKKNESNVDLFDRADRNGVLKDKKNPSSKKQIDNIYNTRQHEDTNHVSWRQSPEENRTRMTKPQPVDRFMEIKNDLRVLRKELNECASPLEVRRSPYTSGEQGDGGVNTQQNYGRPNQGIDSASSKPNSQLKNINNPDYVQTNWRQEAARNTNRNEELAARLHQLPAAEKNTNPRNQAGDQVSAASNDGMGGVNKRSPKNAHNMAMLPCEFCHTMVPANQLIDHELLCPLSEPPDAPEADDSFRSYFHDEPPRVRAPHAPRARVGPFNADMAPSPQIADEFEGHHELKNVILPCEFCHSMIPAKFFIAHETGCNPLATSILPPSKNDPDNRTNINNIENVHAAPPNTPEGQHTLKNINLNRNIKKPISVSANIANRQMEDRVVNDEQVIRRPLAGDLEEAVGHYNSEEVELPCEFCMSLVPASELMLHQEECYAD